MTKTIDLSPGEGNRYGWNLGFPLDWDVACDLLGLSKRRGTRNEYRQWLDLAPGERIDEIRFYRLDLMFKFSNYRGGANFSRAGYLALENGIRSRVAQDHPEAGASLPRLALKATQAHLRERYGINPYEPEQT